LLKNKKIIVVNKQYCYTLKLKLTKKRILRNEN
jgi:hypothetical protein